MLVNKIFAILMAGSSMPFAAETALDALYTEAHDLKKKSTCFSRMDEHQKQEFASSCNEIHRKHIPNVVRVSHYKAGFYSDPMDPDFLRKATDISEILKYILETTDIEITKKQKKKFNPLHSLSKSIQKLIRTK